MTVAVAASDSGCDGSSSSLRLLQLLKSPLARLCVTSAVAPPFLLPCHRDCAVLFLQSVTWNGTPITGISISYFDLMQGGTLQFTMTDVAPAGAGTPSAAAASAAVPQWVQSAAAGSHARLRARGSSKGKPRAKASGSGSA